MKKGKWRRFHKIFLFVPKDGQLFKMPNGRQKSSKSFQTYCFSLPPVAVGYSISFTNWDLPKTIALNKDFQMNMLLNYIFFLIFIIIAVYFLNKSLPSVAGLFKSPYAIVCFAKSWITLFLFSLHVWICDIIPDWTSSASNHPVKVPISIDVGLQVKSFALIWVSRYVKHWNNLSLFLYWIFNIRTKTSYFNV